jgi:tRNA (cytidine/uridine-2'-O-)-methyltransferase
MRLVLFQPDIPQNAGTMLRLAACLGVSADIIEPCGFVLDDRRLRRSGMDYLDGLDLAVHHSWDAYHATEAAGRLILLTTAASVNYTEFAFAPDDRIMVGRETGGAPPQVAAAADARLAIPLAQGRRSLNVATAAAMVLGEALRQTDGFPHRSI